MRSDWIRVGVLVKEREIYIQTHRETRKKAM